MNVHNTITLVLALITCSTAVRLQHSLMIQTGSMKMGTYNDCNSRLDFGRYSENDVIKAKAKLL